MHALYLILSRSLVVLCCALVACSEASSVDAEYVEDVEDVGEIDAEFTPPPIPKCTDMSANELRTDYTAQWMNLNLNERGPYCVREDGFGGTPQYCESVEPAEELYFYCFDSETTTTEGVPVQRETPCMWWPQLAEDDQGNCYHDFRCVPEDRLTEIGWPEDAGFEYHTNYFSTHFCEQGDLPGGGPGPQPGG